MGNQQTAAMAAFTDIAHPESALSWDGVLAVGRMEMACLAGSATSKWFQHVQSTRRKKLVNNLIVTPESTLNLHGGNLLGQC
jgi:hypothetical protein